MTQTTFIQILVLLHGAGAICFVLFLKNSPKIAGYISTAISVLGLSIFSKMYLSKQFSNQSWEWFQFKYLDISFGLNFDFESVTMLILVNFIGALVAFFSTKYLENDPGLNRYYSFLSLFIVSMMLLVLATSLIQMYFFWELVGFCSYLMVGFWYQKPTAIAASKKAFLVNRIGDIGFALGIFLLLQIGHNTDLATLSQIGKNHTISLCLIVACIAKSAQFPLHFWLPNAMEGPTPVSALIHAATMVAAGIFLIVRTLPIFDDLALQTMLIFGSVTMVMGAIKAFFQNDIKKILAYSTISQLGLMVVALGLNNANAAFFHLTTHAFFKAGLFLGAGALIHYVHETNHQVDPQDIRNMRGVFTLNPFFSSCFLIMLAALVGLPGTAGFVSKDAIVELAFEHNKFVGVVLILGILLTAAYCFRLFSVVFLGKSTQKQSFSLQFNLPVFLLAVCSTFLIVYTWPNAHMHFNYISIMAILAILAGFAIAYFSKKYYFAVSQYSSPFDKLYDQKLNKWLLKITSFFQVFENKIIDGIVVLLEIVVLSLAQFAAWFDRNIVDGFVNFLPKTIQFIGQKLKGLQAGQLQWYVASLIIFLFVIFGFFVGWH